MHQCVYRLLSGLCLLSFVWTGHLGAQQYWNQWRGPNRDGISPDTGLLKPWPQDGPRLVWKATGLGGGFSGVSRWADRLFTMGDKADQCYLVAIDAKDGKVLWSTPVGKSGGNDPQRPGPRCIPATDGQLVFALGQYGELVAVEIDTGRILWKVSYLQDLGATEIPRWNFAESPLLDGDRLICLPGGPKGYMAALDKKTGKVLWQTHQITDNANYTSAIAADIAGVRQYIAMSDSKVIGVGLDGTILWQAPRAGSRAVVPTPIYRDSIVFVTSGYGVGAHAFRINTDAGQFKPEQIFANRDLDNHHGGAILVGDYIYMSADPGILVCAEFKTGKIVWQDQSVGKGSLVYADGHLILRSENGPVALVEATPEGYREKGRFQQPDRSKYNSWPHPVVTGGRLYLRDQEILLCYDLRAAN